MCDFPLRRWLVVFNIEFSLQMRSNRLTALPREMGKLSSLESLNVEVNSLSSLPEEIGIGCVNLKVITLHLYQPLSASRYLQVLLLASNKLVSVPRSLTSLKRLERLNLQKNPIDALDAQVRSAGCLPLFLSQPCISIQIAPLLDALKFRCEGNGGWLRL
jgi:hypothetical protein